MPVSRRTFILVGFISCLLFLSVDAVHAQVPYARAYLFVEVKDTAGNRVTDADVAVSLADGKQMLVTKTPDSGRVKTSFDGEQAKRAHHCNLRISKPGYLPYEQVFFLYTLADDHYTWIAGIESLSNSDEDIRIQRSSPAVVVLRRIPATPAERRAEELDEPKRQLLLAAKRGDSASLRKLLQAGLKPDAADANGVPAIAWAALAGDPETIALLLDAGANVRNKNQQGHQALLIYLYEGISRGYLASSRGSAGVPESESLTLERRGETVRKLLEAGAGVNLRQSYRGTVLNCAIAQTPYSAEPPHGRSARTIGLLIARGANVNIADPDGQTPLMMAVEKQSVEVTQMLLRAGARASIEAKGRQGNTALMRLLMYHEPTSKLVEVLIAAGANVNAVNDDGETALMSAARTQSIKVAKVLLGAAASINAKDKQGQTALMYVQRVYSTSAYGIVRTLIAAGANVNAVDRDGQTALMILATQRYDPDIIKALLEGGASINAKGKGGRTLLMDAIGNQSLGIETVKLLLASGADVTIRDDQGQTALMIATSIHRPEAFIKLLEQSERRR